MSSENTIPNVPTPAEKKPDWMPLNPARRRALIGHMLLDKQVFMLVKEHIKPEHFEDDHGKNAYKMLLAYYDHYKFYPDPASILNYEYFEREFVNPTYRSEMRAYINKAVGEAPTVKREGILQDLDQWIKVVKFYNGLIPSISSFNAHKWTDCYGTMKTTMDEVFAVNLLKDGTVRWEDFFESVVRSRVNLHNDLLTFGLNSMDQCLVDPSPDQRQLVDKYAKDVPALAEILSQSYVTGSPAPEAAHRMLRKGFYGSLRKGDTTILLAPTNVGKTTTLITVAISNVLLGRDVLFLSHEGVSEDLQMKMMRALLGVTENQVIASFLSKDPSERLKYDFAQKLLARHLTYQSVQVAGNTVENVAARIQRLNEKRYAEYGKGYDLLVDDYPANLTTQEAKGGQLSRRERDDRVYGIFVDLAGELNLHALLAIQTNREGSRKNKEGDDEETAIIEVEDVSESFGTMMRATNVISINRPPAAEKNGWLIYNLAKTRSSEKGWKVVAKSDFANGRAHWYSLRSEHYKGTNTSTQNIEMLLKNGPQERRPLNVVPGV